MSKYWLLKTEPETFSIDDLKKNKTEPWTGVRNYQARNNMLAMEKGDKCFLYHSSTEVIGIAGLCTVSKTKVVDETQFDPSSDYYDPKSTKENPRWYCVEVKFVKKFPKVITLEAIKKDKKLSKMRLVQQGSRLSVQDVTEKDFEYILKNLS
mgnify:CR=1 FL=1